MIEFLFLDLDDTILDFHKAEQIALVKTFRDVGVEADQQMMDRYTAINLAHWQALERKELTRDQVVTGRFTQLFTEYGIEADGAAVALLYENYLSQGHYFLPGAEEALKSLSKKYKLYLASNGTAKVQAGRLKSADISRYFQQIFVSEELGANKPDKLFFDRCAQRIPGYDPEKALMAGDSLTSDIQGGINAGMKTVWINFRNYAPRADIVPDHTLSSIRELEALLETL